MCAVETEATRCLNTPAAWSERAQIKSPHEAVMWSAESQRERFKKVLEHLDPQPGEWLLDFGCGTGALVDVLPDGVRYYGYDWSVGMIERARQEYAYRPGRLFSVSRPRVHEHFDLIACIGTFNLAHNWSKEDTWCVLRTLWNGQGWGCRTLVCCLYAGLDPRCLSYSEDNLRRFAGTLGSDVRIDRWRANDILVKLSR